MGNYCCCPGTKNSEDNQSQNNIFKRPSAQMKFTTFNTYNNYNSINGLQMRKRKPKAFNPFKELNMPDYSINKDISQTLEIKSDEDALMFGGPEGVDSSHPSLYFGDLTAIINEQNKSKDSPSRPKPQARVEMKSVVSFGNFNMIAIPETVGRQKEPSDQ